jgi:hypothetical protein
MAFNECFVLYIKYILDLFVESKLCFTLPL